MRAALFALVFALSDGAYAGSASAVVIAGGYWAPPPAARILAAADYVAVPLSVPNDAQDPVKRAGDIERAVRAITERVAQHRDLKTQPGVVSLSPREHTKSFGSYDASGGSSAPLYVLGALRQDATGFTAVSRIYQAVSAVPLADGIKVTLGNTMLGMDDPEKHRNKLLSVSGSRRSPSASR
jgi:hypothetical protein